MGERVSQEPSKDSQIQDETKAEGTLSLDELDAVIAQEDPEFRNALEDIQSEEAKSELNIDLIDLDEVLRERDSLTIKSRMKRLVKYVHSKSFMLWIQFKNLGQLTIEVSLAVGRRAWSGLKDAKTEFMSWPLKMKFLLFGLIFLTLGMFWVIFRTATGGHFFDVKPLFLRSLSEWSSQEFAFDPARELEPFFDSARVAQNLFELKRVVVNLKPSESSGPNPMAAIEFYVEGTSTESIVEVKDREPEIRDRVQRIIEEMTYDQISSADGKQTLTEHLRREVNKLVTMGQIRKVYIKTIAVKK
jgi:flagellar basal body-associated protein FliL